MLEAALDILRKAKSIPKNSYNGGHGGVTMYPHAVGCYPPRTFVRGMQLCDLHLTFKCHPMLDILR